MTYYVVLLDGVPLDVTTVWSRAVKSKEELTVPGKDAIILPCEPREVGDFEEEQDTDMDWEGPGDCGCGECKFNERSEM